MPDQKELSSSDVIVTLGNIGDIRLDVLANEANDPSDKVLGVRHATEPSIVLSWKHPNKTVRVTKQVLDQSGNAAVDSEGAPIYEITSREITDTDPANIEVKLA